ncbi:MAG: flagellar filament capping protein FliD, partial [Deltaproteobacteria bacterium]|nr:flagellar filament capping protein FliD [Deltaproteobacteria bacterium]
MSSTVQSSSSYLPSEYLSGGLSIAGLTGGGTDFNAMIDQLRKIEMIPTQRMLRWKADWRERQDAFGVVREALVNLRDVCAKMNSMNKFLVKTATSSEPSKATAIANSEAISNSYKLEINKVATTSIWSLNSMFASGSSKVNNGPDDATFSYEYKGTVRKLTVPKNTSLEALKNMINNDTGNPGVRATIIKGSEGVTFQIKGMDQGEDNDLAILSTEGLEGGFAGSTFPPHELTYKTNVAWANLNGGGEVYANSSSSMQVFTYTYNGVTKNIDINGKATMQDFITALNADLPPGLNAITATEGANGNVELHFQGTVPGEAIVVPKGGNFEGLGIPTTTSADPGFTGSDPVWEIRHSENAQIKIDGWPSGTNNWLEVPSNTVSDVVDGLTFTLIGQGESVISVNTDSEAITENVVEFVDAVNNLRTTITELTKYDANKATVDLNYAESLYDMQKGSILTGNYGIQLISSRMKQATAGMPLGFVPMYKQGDLMLGDLYTSLSQIGIKTKADGQGGDGFGLLELNTDPNLPMLDAVLHQ